MKKYLFAGVALLMITVGSVAAEEMNWTGFYVGINSGYSFGHSDANYDPSFSVSSIDSDPDGWSIGGQVGANYQLTRESLKHVVLGLEVEASYLDVSDTIHDSVGGGNNTIKTSSDCAGTIRGRIGYAVGQFLPYFTAGVAGANAKVSATDGLLSESDFLVGWTIGAGLEYALTKNWSVRAEYLHVDLGEHTWFGGDPWKSKSSLTSETIRFGVNYKF